MVESLCGWICFWSMLMNQKGGGGGKVGVGGTTSAAGYASTNDAVDYYLKSRGFKQPLLSDREVVLNSLNPKWIKKITLSYQFELVQTFLLLLENVLQFMIGGVSFQMLKLDEQQFLGDATCTSSEGSIYYPLLNMYIDKLNCVLIRLS
ncbi:unnamed protein product [Brassica napus]|uniref:(rape) hypothetical protein n=1 Tax=Brassica napus TaxID=3708 RepID=A0A816NX24_BRANA|nr:unnamed protein product [Brassica napus]